MAQLSRTYQVAIAAVLVLALVGVLAMRLHGKNPSEPVASSPSSSSSQAAKPAGTASNPASPTPVYHGAAPGVEGLTKDIAKAHGAVATSQQNAKQLQSKSAQASNEPSSAQTSSHAGSPAAAKPAVTKTAPAAHRAPAAAKSTGPAKPAPKRAQSGERPAQQRQVEAELKQGKTVMLVFWDSKSSVDASVRSEALALARGSKGKVAVHLASAKQVGLFGSVTEVAHVYQTPTILIVNPRHAVTTLTGLTDRFTLQQALREAQQAR